MPLIPGIKNPDESLREVHDKVRDIFGPLGCMYQNFLPLISAMENGEEVTLDRRGVTGFMNCPKKSVMLVGDVAAIFTTRQREQVLTKLNPSLASLGKEEFPESGKQLFGDGFEARLKARSETVQTVGQQTLPGKCFFRLLPLGEGAATEQAVLDRASPNNIAQGCREPGLHSTGTLELGSNTNDFRQQEAEERGEPATHHASIKGQTSTTTRYVFTFKSH